VATHDADVEATGAELHVSIQGTSLVTGSAALKKAREVAQLVTDLATVGVAETDVRLQGVQANVSTHLLGKTSAAVYALKIHVGSLERVGDVVGVIAAQKNTTLSEIEWQYPPQPPLRAAWLAACVREANERARVAAEALGVKVVGVHRLSEELHDPEAGPRGPAMLAETSGFAARARMTRDDLGMDVSHTKRVTLKATIEYRIGGYAER